MTKRQRDDIDCIKWFYQPARNATEAQEEEYLLHSEKGTFFSNNPLIEGKRWRGITIYELWEKGIVDGSVSYFTLLGGEDDSEIMPRNLVDFFKKSMFKGGDSELIENTYQNIVKQHARSTQLNRHN